MEQNRKELIKEVLEKGYLMSLATQDEGGIWVSDLIYLYDEDFNIYWMSSPDVRHSKAFLKNNNVAGSITVNGKGDNNLGIQFEGVAAKLEGSRPDLVRQHFAKMGKEAPRETDDVLQGDKWYVAKLSKIDLIYEKLFGFEKKSITL